MMKKIRFLSMFLLVSLFACVSLVFADKRGGVNPALQDEETPYIVSNGGKVSNPNAENDTTPIQGNNGAHLNSAQGGEPTKPAQTPQPDTKPSQVTTGQTSVSSEDKAKCDGIKLNTDLPFLGRCIGATTTSADGVTQLNAFAYMLKGLMKIVVSIVLVVSFLMIVAAGVLMTTSGFDKGYYSKGVEMIKSVAKALAMLGASGVILKLINPNFFT